ncbi:MAG: ATPase, partial [Oscillospiraceae bacterium]|nr:ATPase [Oscillospiraceae bacterium]
MIKDQIKEGKVSIGIEFGSTRIKAILVGQNLKAAASGAYDWQNALADGVWTYSLEDIHKGLQTCFANLMADVKSRYGVELTTAASIGFSAMMHGYLAFDDEDNLLVPFRTWRNTMTEEAADKLSESFGFNIPQRWSIAHLYQAILNKEEHVSRVSFFTTLAGYVHWLLTGEKNLGVGDASGMFPIDPETGVYNKTMLEKFSRLTEGTAFTQNLEDILPAIIPVGECAGRLTEKGALLLDPTGTFRAGVPFCPAEGDAQTGMVATNSIAPRTGNVSAGTSIFAMAVLERDLLKLYRQIDIVTTPCADPVAMVHCNNCTTDLDSWVKLFGELLRS